MVEKFIDHGAKTMEMWKPGFPYLQSELFISPKLPPKYKATPIIEDFSLYKFSDFRTLAATSTTFYKTEYR